MTSTRIRAGRRGDDAFADGTPFPEEPDWGPPPIALVTSDGPPPRPPRDRRGGGGDGDEPEEQHHGQLRFAERFTRAYDGEFLHAHGIGWHSWDGARWAECKDGAETRAVIDLVKDALGEVPALNADDRKALIKDVQRCESAGGVNGVLDLAKAMHPCTVAAENLDADRHLLNTAAGTVDLRTGQIRACSPADRLSKVTSAPFDPDARSDVFDEFLDRIQPEPEMRAFLARCLGSALLGVVRDHVLLIWYGQGANGKGTLRDAVRHALGDYAVEVPADILLVNRHGQQALAPERMRLRGARAAFCSEIANGAKLDEATMKKLTGGDPVNAKLLYRNPVEFDPSHTLFMLTNHLPQVRGDDPATWRRIQAVPFDVIVPTEERDGRLPERLKEAAPAILAWLWAGWLDYQRRGLNPPQAVVDATKKYREDSDLLARFLAADAGQVIFGHGTVASAQLYGAFKQWCSREGEEQQLTNKAFTEQMEKHGHRKKRSKQGIAWQNMMLAASEDDE